MDEWSQELLGSEETEIDLSGEEMGYLEDESDYGDEGEFFQEGENEEQETQLAADLLGVSNEDELDHFLGNLMKRAGRAAKGVLRTAAGQQLKTLLRATARKALPIAGRAVGTYFAGARGGEALSRLSTAGGRLFGLEIEGLSPEDQEMTIARRYVRLAQDATRRTAAHAHSLRNPRHIARGAFAAAARRHAPGLMGTLSAATAIPGRGGRWIRRGRTIIVFGG